LRAIALERREAIQLFREICDNIPDIALSNCIVLKPQSRFSDAFPKFYELHIRAVLDEFDLNRLRTMVEKRNLFLETASGYIVIGSVRESNCLEVTA